MSDMAEPNELASAVADAVVARLNTVPAETFDRLRNGWDRQRIPGVSPMDPYTLDIMKSDTTLLIRIADPVGQIVCQFVYGRE